MERPVPTLEKVTVVEATLGPGVRIRISHAIAREVVDPAFAVGDPSDPARVLVPGHGDPLLAPPVSPIERARRRARVWRGGGNDFAPVCRVGDRPGDSSERGVKAELGQKRRRETVPRRVGRNEAPLCTSNGEEWAAANAQTLRVDGGHLRRGNEPVGRRAARVTRKSNVVGYVSPWLSTQLLTLPNYTGITGRNRGLVRQLGLCGRSQPSYM